MKQRIILHVGMHKTATTFLQRDIFPYLENVHYLGRNSAVGEVFSRLIQTNPLLFNLAEEKKQVDSVLSQIDEPHVLISDERLFGHYEQGYFDNKYFTDVLAHLFPEAQIFVTFRKQDEWLESLYHQTFHTGRTRPIDKFLNYYQGEFIPYAPIASINGSVDISINPYPFLQNYQQVFGKNNVLALPYEFFKVDMTGFLDHFYQFFQLAPYYPKKSRAINRSFSLTSCYLSSFINRFITSKEQREKANMFLKKKLDKCFYIPARFITDDKRERLMAMHHESNRQLGELIGMDLAQYGYY